jgi:hypothetical protein
MRGDAMKLNPKEKAVLAGVLLDAEDLAGTDPASLGLPYGVALGRVKMKIADAKAGYVPMNLAGWIGHAPSPSESVMFHRAYKRLEALGLANLYGYGERTSHLRLTDAGERIARQLLEMEATR